MPLVFGVSVTLLTIYGYGISFLMEETTTRTVFPENYTVMAENGLPRQPSDRLPMTNLEWCFALGDYDDCITTT